MSIIVNPIMDKDRFRLCFTGGSTFLVFSIVLTSFCTEYWQLLLVEDVLTGIGIGLMFGSGVIVLMSYFSTHLGLASGIAASGGSTGGMIYPLIGRQLIFRIGYAWTVRVIALIALLCTYSAFRQTSSLERDLVIPEEQELWIGPSFMISIIL
jgi:MFS family permease